MHIFNAGRLLISINGLNMLAQGMPGNPRFVIPKTNYEEYKKLAEYVLEELERLELPTTAESASEVLQIILKEAVLKTNEEIGAGPGAQFGPWMLFDAMPLSRLRASTTELVRRFRSEMGQRTVFAVSPVHTKYLANDKPLFGIEVFNALPSAANDIAEASACLALGRSTACVMHLMRIAEVGLSALASAVSVVKQNDWGSYLREIDKALVAKAKAGGARSADEQFYSEAAASFDHVRRAWRNPTMHIEKSYSPERAEEIYLAVRSFMRHLATKISEQTVGPLA